MTEPKPTYTPRKRAPGAGPKFKPGKSFLITIRCADKAEYDLVMAKNPTAEGRTAKLLADETGEMDEYDFCNPNHNPYLIAD